MTVPDLPPDQWPTVIPLPAGADAPAIARQFVQSHAGDLAPELIDDALIIVSELVTNAVLYGRPEIRLRLRDAPPGIGLGVQDAGQGAPQLGPADADPSHPRGRGLRIVDQLASAWGVTSTPPGKIVWFELRGQSGTT